MTEPLQPTPAAAGSPVTVVVPTRNRPGHLTACLAQVAPQLRPGDHLVVVDSASTPPLPAGPVTDAWPTARVLRRDQPGASAARNTGWRAADTELVAFLDDDIRVGAGWRTALEAAMSGVGAACGRVTVPADQVGAERPVAVTPDCPEHLLTPGAVVGVSANLVTRRDVLASVGGFDDRLGPGTWFASAEDLDLLDRLLHAGHLVRYAPSLLAFHEQWRRRRALITLDWGYGKGAGARAVRTGRRDPALGRAQLKGALWHQGLGPVGGDLRRGYQLGVITSLARTGGAMAGLTAALLRRDLRPGAGVKVGLYHPWVYLHSGIERWMLELIARSRHDWTIYTHHHDPAGTYPAMAAQFPQELSPRISVRRSLGPLLHATAVIAAARLPPPGRPEQALLVSSEGLGDLVALRSRVPTLGYCHTPLKILHDPAAAQVVRRESLRRRAALGTLGPAFGLADRLAWRRYEHVLVNSGETLARVRAAGLRPAGPLEVLEPGVDERWFTGAATAREPGLFLYAGRIMWQKNVELALAALRLVLEREPGSPAHLVAAGTVDAKSRPYLAALRQQAEGLPVTFEVGPTDERLRALYASAQALLFTPRNEDFGMVVLEAMAAGTPVLAVDAGGPRGTVTPGRTGWLLAPDPAVFAEQMTAVLRSGPAGLAPLQSACVAAARTRTWDRHVHRLDDVVEEVVRRAAARGTGGQPGRRRGGPAVRGGWPAAR